MGEIRGKGLGTSAGGVLRFWSEGPMDWRLSV